MGTLSTVARLGLLLGGVVVLNHVGCQSSVPRGSSTSADSSAPSVLAELTSETGSVTSLEFTNPTSIPSNVPPPADVTVSDASKAQGLYAATLQLPSAVSIGPVVCPLDWGIRFRLVFRDGAGIVIATATVDWSCQLVDIGAPGGSSLSLSYYMVVPGDYWDTLASTLGVTQAQLDAWDTPLWAQDAGSDASADACGDACSPSDAGD